MNLIAFLQAAQDGNRVLNVRLTHENNLETAFERRILLNIFAVFVQRGSANSA